MKIRIITDSASDLSNGFRSDITVIPLKVLFGGKEYLDGATLSHQEFYNRLIESDELPTTSQVSPYEFETEYIRAKREGEQVIVICLSSKLSGTYQSAVIAAAGYEDMVHIVDSESVAVGERILVEYALRLVDQGLGVSEMVEKLERAKKKICLIALLDTLEYLVRGGRLSRTAGVLGGVLSLKPVITISEGEVMVLCKARGSKNGNNLLTEKINQSGGVDFSMPIALGYTGLNDELLKKYVSDSEYLWKDAVDGLNIGSIGCSIGTHAGPGAIAVAYFSK